MASGGPITEYTDAWDTDPSHVGAALFDRGSPVRALVREYFTDNPADIMADPVFVSGNVETFTTWLAGGNKSTGQAVYAPLVFEESSAAAKLLPHGLHTMVNSPGAAYGRQQTHFSQDSGDWLQRLINWITGAK